MTEDGCKRRGEKSTAIAQRTVRLRLRAIAKDTDPALWRFSPYRYALGEARLGVSGAMADNRRNTAELNCARPGGGYVHQPSVESSKRLPPLDAISEQVARLEPSTVEFARPRRSYSRCVGSSLRLRGATRNMAKLKETRRLLRLRPGWLYDGQLGRRQAPWRQVRRS